MKRTTPSGNPLGKTPHKAPVTAAAPSVLVRPTKETALAAQEEALKQKEHEAAQLRAEIERKTAELMQKEALLATQVESVARQEAALKQRADDVTKSELAYRLKAEEMARREREAARREAELTQKAAALHQQVEQFRQRQALYEKTQRECDERVGEITAAVETLNAQAAELDQQAKALADREGQVTARESQLTARESRSTARVAQTPRRPLHSPTPTPMRVPEVVAAPERVIPPKSWVDQHSLLVRDQRAIHYSYDETLQKEVDRGMSKVDYLNAVIEVMPIDTALENQMFMFGAILENRNSQQDSLLRTKLKIALEVIYFVSVMGDYAPKPLNTGLLGMFSKAVEKLPTPLELERFKQFKDGVLRAKSLDDLDTALRFVKTSGSALSCSPAYERCVTQCEGMISELQSRCVVGPHGF